MQPSAVRSDLQAIYQRSLWRRWPHRTRYLALAGIGMSVVTLPLDLALSPAPATPGLIALARLGWLVVPVAGWLLSILGVRWRWLPAASTALGTLFSLGNDWACYVLGTQRTAFHAVMLVTCLNSLICLLPLQTFGRRMVYGAFAVGHLTIDLTFPDAHPLTRRLWELGALLLAGLSVSYTLDYLFRSLQRMFFLRQEMEGTVALLEASRGQLGAAAASLSGAVAQLGESARGLQQHAESTREESRTITGASELVARAAASLQQRARSSASAAEEAHVQTRTADALVSGIAEGVRDIGEAVSASEQSFNQLRERTARIGAFAQRVQQVATRTQMLSLNASIQAVSAGEHGRGFAVVAQEVRKLALEVGADSRDIGQTVEEVQAQMLATLSTVEALRARTARFEEDFTRARSALEDVTRRVTAMQEGIGASARDADSQAQVTQDISSGSARLAQLVHEQARMSAELAGTTASLTRLAETLRALVPDSAVSAPAPAAED